MKTVFNYTKNITALAVTTTVILFSSCSKDDDTVRTTTDLIGDYSGKVIVTSVNPLENNTPTGTDVSASIKNDTIYFDKLPVDGIIKAIIKDETSAEAIIKALGDVKYKVGYTSLLNSNKDSIQVTLNAKPLELSLVMQEGAPKTKVKVNITSKNKGSFAYDGGVFKMKLDADKIEVNEAVLPAPAMTFNFNMNKK